MSKEERFWIVAVSILTLPVSLPYWFAWAMIEVIREDDGTIWTENPLTIKPKQRR
jgi:hypothetical protein